MKQEVIFNQYKVVLLRFLLLQWRVCAHMVISFFPQQGIFNFTVEVFWHKFPFSESEILFLFPTFINLFFTAQKTLGGDTVVYDTKKNRWDLLQKGILKMFFHWNNAKLTTTTEKSLFHCCTAAAYIGYVNIFHSISKLKLKY